MPVAFDLVTIDASDSVSLASFWASALHLVECEREDNGRWIVLATAATQQSPSVRRIGIQRIPGLKPKPAVWDGDLKSRIHLDVRCEPREFNAEVERLIRSGALELRTRRTESYGSIATLADPEGNVFDVCAYNDVS
jgi:hypothetical protein